MQTKDYFIEQIRKLFMEPKFKPPKSSTNIIIGIVLYLLAMYALNLNDFSSAFVLFTLGTIAFGGSYWKYRSDQLTKKDIMINPKPPNEDDKVNEIEAKKFFEENKLPGGDTNYATAILKDECDNEKSYFASSKLSIGKKVNTSDEDVITILKINEYEKNLSILSNSEVKVCADADYNKSFSPLVMLNKDMRFINVCKNELIKEFKNRGYKITEHHNFEEFVRYSFEGTRAVCTEKKILNKILFEYEDRLDDLKKCSMIIYSDFAPCLSCYGMLQMERDKFNSLEFYYNDMMFTFDENEISDLELNAYEKFKDIKTSVIEKKEELYKKRGYY